MDLRSVQSDYALSRNYKFGESGEIITSAHKMVKVGKLSPKMLKVVKSALKITKVVKSVLRW